MRRERIPACEKDFLLETLALNARAENRDSKLQRLDGRTCRDFREVKVVVGTKRGSCIAKIGQSKVYAEVIYLLVKPHARKGNLGLVDVQVDMSPMACPNHASGKLGRKGFELMRILEFVYRNCGVIDLESLCVRISKQVWKIRIIVHVLDADGSLVDCASVASIAALMHSRRPQVTVLQNSTVVHTMDEKVPVPLNIYHMPICVTFGIAADAQYLVVDLNDKEERCLDASFLVATNRSKEVCALRPMGHCVVTDKLIKECVGLAAQRAKDVTELIMTVIIDDDAKRLHGGRSNGFGNLTHLNFYKSNRSEPNELLASTVKTNLMIMDDAGPADTGLAASTKISQEPMRDDGASLRVQGSRDFMKQMREIRAHTVAKNRAEAKFDMDETSPECRKRLRKLIAVSNA